MAPVKKIVPKKFSSKKKVLKSNGLKKKSFVTKSNGLKKKSFVTKSNGWKKKSLVTKSNGLKKKSFKKKAAVLENRRGAVFFSNLPHGFYDRALDRYLEQFGEIHKMKVAKSLKNAKPLGYAYVEFEHEKVALIVAKTMNNYLMFKKLLKCKFIKHEDLNNKMWANSSITPELCTGTIQKRKNQFLLETNSTDGYVEKKIKKGKKMNNYLKNTLGLKLVNEDDENEKIRITLDDNDEEISIKTPPNVIMIRKNKTVRPVICDGDATTVKKVLRKRRSSSLEPVAKELFNKNVKLGNNNKKLKLNSDKSETKHVANLSKTEPLSNARLSDNMKKKVVSTLENKTLMKKSRTDKSLKKVIDDKVSYSTNEESLTPKKHNKKVIRKSPRSPPSDDVQTGNFEMPLQNKTLKSSKKGCRVVIGNFSSSPSPVIASTNIIKQQDKGTPKSSSSPIKRNVNTPSQKLSKKAKVMPTPDNIKISDFAKKNKTPKLPNVNKNMPRSPKIASSAEKVIFSEKNEQRFDNSKTQRITSQKMVNRRASLGVKKAAIVKTPKTNRVRSRNKIHLPVSV